VPRQLRAWLIFNVRQKNDGFLVTPAYLDGRIDPSDRIRSTRLQRISSDAIDRLSQLDGALGDLCSVWCRVLCYLVGSQRLGSASGGRERRYFVGVGYSLVARMGYTVRTRSCHRPRNPLDAASGHRSRDGHYHMRSRTHHSKKEPNQALEPTRTAVTAPAEPGAAPAVRVAHL